MTKVLKIEGQEVATPVERTWAAELAQEVLEKRLLQTVPVVYAGAQPACRSPRSLTSLAPLALRVSGYHRRHHPGSASHQCGGPVSSSAE